MKNITAIILVALSLSVASCTTTDLQANMDTARAISAQIKQGVAVSTAAVRQAVDLACANQSAVGVASQAARALLIQQVGPNTTRNIDNLDTAMASYTTVCAAASDPNASNLSSLLSRAIAAYAAVQAATAKAKS